MIVSHSDGINPFLSLVEQSEKIKDPCYCATFAIEFEIKDGHARVVQSKEKNESVFII